MKLMRSKKAWSLPFDQIRINRTILRAEAFVNILY